MNLQKVEKQYLDHYSRLHQKVKEQNSNPTEKQTLGMAYYLQAAGTVGRLINYLIDHKREGFIMKTSEELAPVRMGFGTPVEVTE